MKKYAQICIKTMKSYELSFKEMSTDEFNAIKDNNSLAKESNFIPENTLLLPVLNNIYLTKDIRGKTGICTYDVFVDIYENDILKSTQYYSGSELNNFCCDLFLPNKFSKNSNAGTFIVKADDIGSSETFYKIKLDEEEDFDIKNIVVSNMRLDSYFSGICALKKVYYIRKESLRSIKNKLELHANEIYTDVVNFIDEVFCSINQYHILQRDRRRRFFIEELEKNEIKKICVKTKKSINAQYLFCVIVCLLVYYETKKSYTQGITISVNGDGIEYFEFGYTDKKKMDALKNSINEKECKNFLKSLDYDISGVYLHSANVFINDKEIKDWAKLTFKLPIDSLDINNEDDKLYYSKEKQSKNIKHVFNIPIDENNFVLDDLYIGIYSSPLKESFNDIIYELYHIPKAVAKYIMNIYGKEGELRDYIEEIFENINKNFSITRTFGYPEHGSDKYIDTISYLNKLFYEYNIENNDKKPVAKKYNLKVFDKNMSVLKSKVLIFDEISKIYKIT